MRTNANFYLLFLFCLLMSNMVLAQDEKKFKIVMDINENGKQIKIDTTFSSQADFKAFMKENGLEDPNVMVISGMPDLETLKLELEGMELSDEEMKELKEELKKTKMEMRHVKKEMKQSKKELDEANEELKQMWVEIEELEENGEKIIIERIHEGNLDGEKKMIFIQKEGESGEMKDVHILKVPCDADKGDHSEKVFIRKIEVSEDGKNAEWTEDLTSPVNTENKNNSEENETTDYRLGVKDFKLFPNPTNDKVTVSFQLTNPGPVEIRLLDTSGRLVADANIDSENGFISREFNIEGKSRGTYLMQIKQGNKWRHEKIVLK